MALMWPADPPLASTLTALHLCRSHVREETLGKNFAITPNLKTFEYDFLCDIEFYALHKAHLDSAKLWRSLQQVKASLETLIISVLFVAFTAFDVEAADILRWGIKGDLGSLSDFTKLKTLNAPLVVLLGWLPKASARLSSTLPLNLRYFCCTNDMASWDCWRWTDEAVLGQFQDYLSADTSLELGDLELCARESPHLWREEVRQYIKTLCVEAGIWYEYNHN